MTLTFHWFLPTSGDSRNITGGGHGADVVHRDRRVTTRYLRQIVTAAEELGFEGALTPTGLWCDDAWLSTASLLASTDRLKFLVAFRPGLMVPTLAAQMATTFQNQSGGRLLLNVVTGGEPAEQKAFGDFLSKDERYRRTDEFLAIVRKLWEHGDPFDFQGEHLRVEQARLVSVPDPLPQIYFGGSSAAAGPVAAARSDVYLTWGEPPAAVAEKIGWIRKLAAEAGRTVRFGIRLHVITRDTSEDAWREARRLLAALPPETIAKVQEGLHRSESEGQKRMLSLHGGVAENLEIYPNLWAGVGLARGGAGTALVGSHDEVAERIKEYADLGIEEFVLSGYPHLEEAYWFGESVLPRLERDGLWINPTGSTTATKTAVPFAV